MPKQIPETESLDTEPDPWGPYVEHSDPRVSRLAEVLRGRVVVVQKLPPGPDREVGETTIASLSESLRRKASEVGIDTAPLDSLTGVVPGSVTAEVKQPAGESLGDSPEVSHSTTNDAESSQRSHHVLSQSFHNAIVNNDSLQGRPNPFGMLPFTNLPPAVEPPRSVLSQPQIGHAGPIAYPSQPDQPPAQSHLF